jgi:hypothetical protein
MTWVRLRGKQVRSCGLLRLSCRRALIWNLCSWLQKGGFPLYLLALAEKWMVTCQWSVGRRYQQIYLLLLSDCYVGHHLSFFCTFQDFVRRFPFGVCSGEMCHVGRGLGSEWEETRLEALRWISVLLERHRTEVSLGSWLTFSFFILKSCQEAWKLGLVRIKLCLLGSAGALIPGWHISSITSIFVGPIRWSKLSNALWKKLVSGTANGFP